MFLGMFLFLGNFWQEKKGVSMDQLQVTAVPGVSGWVLNFYQRPTMHKQTKIGGTMQAQLSQTFILIFFTNLV